MPKTLRQRTTLGAMPFALGVGPAPAATAAPATPPTSFRVWPYGQIDTMKGVFTFDEQGAKAVIANYAANGLRVTFDYEHKAVDPDARAGDGKSAGSCLLELKPDGLYAVDVRWTPAASAGLSAREWLYFSPCFETDDEGRIVDLINIALTNVPATRNLPPLVAADRKALSMDPNTPPPAVAPQGPPAGGDAADAAADGALAKAIEGLAAQFAKLQSQIDTITQAMEAGRLSAAQAAQPDPAACATDVAAVAAVPPPAPPSDAPPSDEEKKAMDVAAAHALAAMRASAAPALAGVTTSRIEKCARELTGKSDPSDVIAALHVAFMSATEGAEVVALAADTRRRSVELSVTEAVKAGRLAPRDRDRMIRLGLDDEKAFTQTLSLLRPVVRIAGARLTPDHGSHIATVAGLSKNELQIADRLGIPPAKYAEQKASNEARVRAVKASGEIVDES